MPGIQHDKGEKSEKGGIVRGKDRQIPERIPRERDETARAAIARLLRDRPLDAREISSYVGLPEKEVCIHLEHIKKSLPRQRERFVVQPPECRKCGFVFSKRERLSRPGRCPRCRGESISPPLFSIR
jgi:hypothetical protein